MCIWSPSRISWSCEGDNSAPVMYLVSHFISINREAPSLISTDVTLSSSQETERETKLGREIDSCWIVIITTFDHLSIMVSLVSTMELHITWMAPKYGLHSLKNPPKWCWKYQLLIDPLIISDDSVKVSIS